MVQYFTDPNCIDFVGTSSLSGYGACSATSGNAKLVPATMRTVTCSTANEPAVDDTFVFREYVPILCIAYCLLHNVQERLRCQMVAPFRL